MTFSPEAIATAFSGHRFAEAYPALHEDLRWTLVGASVLVGKAAAIEACESTLAGLAETTTRFTRFDTVVGPDAVVVDSVAEYESADGSITVASCDLYQFRDGQVVAIRSYTVEVPDGRTPSTATDRASRSESFSRSDQLLGPRERLVPAGQEPVQRSSAPGRPAGRPRRRPGPRPGRPAAPPPYAAARPGRTDSAPASGGTARDASVVSSTSTGIPSIIACSSDCPSEVHRFRCRYARRWAIAA